MDEFPVDTSTVPNSSKKDGHLIRNVEKIESFNNNSIATNVQVSSSSSDLAESNSQASIESAIIRSINQHLAEFMSKDKSLQRVDSTPDPIPRFFVTGRSSPRYTTN